MGRLGILDVVEDRFEPVEGPADVLEAGADGGELGFDHGVRDAGRRHPRRPGTFGEVRILRAAAQTAHTLTARRVG